MRDYPDFLMFVQCNLFFILYIYCYILLILYTRCMRTSIHTLYTYTYIDAKTSKRFTKEQIPCPSNSPESHLGTQPKQGKTEAHLQLGTWEESETLGKRWILLWFECHLEDLEDELLWSMAVYGIFGRWFSGCMLLLKFLGANMTEHLLKSANMSVF